MQRSSPVLEWLLVLLQLALIVLYFLTIARVDAFFTTILQIVGAVPMVLGALLAGGAVLQHRFKVKILPSPREEGHLITGGFYKLVRHPIYAGLLYLAFGFALYDQSFYKLLISFLLFILFELKAGYEEALLEEKYPAYAQYKLNTGKFFPIQIRLRRSEVDLEIDNTQEEK